MLQLLPLAFLTSVSAHGGVLWPPTWQAGVATPIEELNSEEVFSDPIVYDANSGRAVKDIKSWLTDQEKCGVRCVDERNPWAAPGQAPSLGGGCGVFGGTRGAAPRTRTRDLMAQPVVKRRWTV